MEAKQIKQMDYLDLLFEGRNKKYGAYNLRKTYGRRLWIAVAVTLLLSFSGFWLLQSGAAKEVVPLLAKKEIVLSSIAEIKTPPPPPQVREDPPAQKPTKAITPVTSKPRAISDNIKRTKFTTPIIKEKVTSEPVPTMDEIVVVDNISVDGVVAHQMMAAPPPPVPTATTEVSTNTIAAPARPKEEENKIFEKVEIQASVNGARWRQHLERNLVRYIEDAAYAGMQPGAYTVMVRFLVERDGSIDRVTALNDPGFALAQGAAQVVKSGPKWNPGEQNGRKVRSYHTQPMTFVIMES